VLPAPAIAVLVKQVPAVEELQLGPDGRLERGGIELEMNPYCRRAVAKSVELAALGGGRITVVTLGPPSAEDVLREAIVWAADRGVPARGVLVSDPAFAGSDTLATARTLSTALTVLGPFDLVLTGRNSVDADTGQVGPGIAELLDLPFLGGARHLHLDARTLHARCEQDDGWTQVEVRLPAVVSTAERLCEPCKVEPDRRARVAASSIETLDAATLGPGPWGDAASPTTVGAIRSRAVTRERRVLEGMPLPDQIAETVAHLQRRNALRDRGVDARPARTVWNRRPGSAPVVGVVIEPDRTRLTSELLGAAAQLAGALGGRTVAFTSDVPPTATVEQLAAWGGDEVVALVGAAVEEDVATGLARWAEAVSPWAILLPGTSWGREVAGRAAVRLGAGLTGDAIDLELEAGRLVAWKSAFGGQLAAAIRATSPIQMVTVRAGALPRRRPRPARHVALSRLPVTPRQRIRVLQRARDDDLDVLADARAVIGVGAGVPPEAYPALDGLRSVLDAELGATRKVTDQGWLPHARQIGITGRSISPRLYVALGTSGKFNHMVGVRAAGTVVAVNPDRHAPVHECADISLVADWRDVVPLLERAIRATRGSSAVLQPMRAR
jgi:electron transfer flavoprotein alpha subunit/electron transfer flavoprotein alpha/beta subunit